jgi:chain length determinant protein tyrosine kinase EpsG
MAKFHDSVPIEPSIVSAAEKTRGAAPAPDAADGMNVVDARTIGAIIAETRRLTADDVERVLRYQREKGLRFGEAAVALGFASNDDVLFALSQQFHYPYAALEQRKANPELVVLNEPFSPQAETFRAIRSQLMMRLFHESQDRRAVAVVSPDSGDGKSFFAANLAVALAQLGGRTLLVDADMRSARQHTVFGIDNRAGLSGILSGRSESKVFQQVAGVPGLFILPVGVTPPNPVELVERPAFAVLLRELTVKFDHVIVDTPAASIGSDFAVIASRCGSALVIGRKNVSRLSNLQALVMSLQQTPAQVAGVIYNEH